MAVAREANELPVSKDGAKWAPASFKVDSQEDGMKMNFTGITFAELR